MAVAAIFAKLLLLKREREGECMGKTAENPSASFEILAIETKLFFKHDGDEKPKEGPFPFPIFRRLSRKYFTGNFSILCTLICGEKNSQSLGPATFDLATPHRVTASKSQCESHLQTDKS